MDEADPGMGFHRISQLVIIPPSHHTRVWLCESPDRLAHYYFAVIEVGGFIFMTRHLAAHRVTVFEVFK